MYKMEVTKTTTTTHNGKYMLISPTDYNYHSDKTTTTTALIESSDDDNDINNYDYNKRTEKFRNKMGLALRHKYKTRRCPIPCRMCKIFFGFCFSAFTLLYIVLYQNNRSSRHYSLPDWNTKLSRNLSNYVLPYQKNTTVLEPRNVCQEKMFLLILVCSGMENFVARQMIRETWGNLSEFNYGTFSQLHANYEGTYAPVMKERLKFYKEYLQLNDTVSKKSLSTLPSRLPVRVLFLLGNRSDQMGNETLVRIQQEFEQYNDIIQENFIDTYNNLTIKSVMALKWLLKNNCYERLAFFMKCDDDTLVNIPNLLHFLLGGTVPLYNDTLEFYDKHSLQQHMKRRDRLNATVDYLLGHKFCNARPVDDISSKWYMPYDMYPNDTYPTYLSGAGYLMSSDIVPKLYEIALQTPLVYLEDVYITGICAERARISRQHHPLFNYNVSKRLCSYKGLIISHGLKDAIMYNAYNFVANFSNRCPPPDKYFKFILLKKKQMC